MTTTATIYTKAEYDKICEFAGSHFEYDDGLIVWKHNGQVIEDEILTKLLNQEDILIYSEMATTKHDQIINNIQEKLMLNLNLSLFRVYGNMPNIFIIINGKEKIRIPDVAVTPRKLALTENKEVTNPLVIFEIVSPSSVQKDYIDKLREYKTLESLQEYIIVEQERNYLVHYQRISAEEWTENKIETDQDFLYLPTVVIKLELQEIYADCEDL
jgi:Uma2 family endonuclease